MPTFPFRPPEFPEARRNQGTFMDDRTLGAFDADTELDEAQDAITDVAADPPSCPHIDRNDVRCGHRFRLGRIEQALDVCFGGFHGCPMFHRINREVGGRSARLITDASTNELAQPPLTIPITINAGNPHRLRATGT